MSESLPPDAPDLSATQYVLEKLLGQGGFGQAYVALNQGLRRRCVVKVLTDTNNAGFVARFYREAQVMANLEHPTIPRVFEVATTKSGQPYFSMELIDGKSLGEHLTDEGGALPLAEASRLIADAAEGLAVAHEMGVVHRDIKLANLLVNKRLQIKVIDFGIAKKTIHEDAERTPGILTAPGHLLGTPRYMSPEQAMAKPLGPASDFYSLGVVLFILLTGRSPFNGTPHEMMTGHVRSPPPKLSEVAGEPFPPAIEALVARLLSKDPSSRFDNGNELAAALRAAGGVAHFTHTGSQQSWSGSSLPAATRDAITAAPTERAAPRVDQAPASHQAQQVTRRTQLQLGEAVQRMMLREPSIVVAPIDAEAAIVPVPDGIRQSFSASTSSTSASSKAGVAVPTPRPSLTDASPPPRFSSADYAATELAMPTIPATGFAPGASPTESRPVTPIRSEASQGETAAKDATPSSLQTAVGISPPLTGSRSRVAPALAVLAVVGLVSAAGYAAWVRVSAPSGRSPAADPAATSTIAAASDEALAPPNAPGSSGTIATSAKVSSTASSPSVAGPSPSSALSKLKPGATGAAVKKPPSAKPTSTTGAADEQY